MFSEEGDGIINSIVFVDKTLFSTVDYATNRTELIDNIAGIIKNLIEFIRNFYISCDLSIGFNKKLIKSFSMFQLKMKFFREFANNSNVCFLLSREEKSSSLFIVHFQLINLRRYLLTRTIYNWNRVLLEDFFIELNIFV